MDNFNFENESNDSNENGFSKEELIEIFETNEKELSVALSSLIIKLKISDYDHVFFLLDHIADQMMITKKFVKSFLTSEYGEIFGDEDEVYDLFDLTYRLN